MIRVRHIKLRVALKPEGIVILREEKRGKERKAT